MPYSPVLKLTITAVILTALSTAGAESVLRRGNGAEPQSIDPQIGEGDAGSNIQRDLFEGLTSEDAQANIIPGVAKSWEVSPDGKTYTFHLRDTRWSDGTPFTAQDVVYAWQRGVDPNVGSTYSFILYPIKNAEKIANGEIKDLSQLGAKATDEHTVVVELEGPTPYFLGLLAHPVAFPVPKHIVEKFGKEWTRPEHIVSNGPFKMQDWQPQSSLTLVKSDQYWDKDAIKLDKVIFYPIEDQKSELQRYRSGGLDITKEIPNDQFKWIQGNLKDELKTAPFLSTYYYGLNMTKPPFKDNLKLRKALALAINRDIITQKVTGVGETPAYSIIPPGITGYSNYLPEYAKWTQAQRNAEAKKLYAEAGYSREHPLHVDILYNTSENHKKIAVAVAAMWKQLLGVQSTLTNREWKVYLSERREKQNTQAFRAGWIGDYNDPNTFLELYLSSSGVNDPGYKDPEFDRLLDLAGKEQDKEKRAALLAQAEKRFTDEFAIIPIYYYVSKHLVKPRVKGFYSNVMDHVLSKHLSVE